jgi:mannose-1-phosphate guanylyltransferase/mannose-6-phosphate isomerase
LILVRVTARVTVSKTVKTVHENESIYIPIGAMHRLENLGKILLELIEVQTGTISARTTSSASRTITGVHE